MKRSLEQSQPPPPPPPHTHTPVNNKEAEQLVEEVDKTEYFPGRGSNREVCDPSGAQLTLTNIQDDLSLF